MATGRINDLFTKEECLTLPHRPFHDTILSEVPRFIRPQRKFASINYTQLEMRIAAEYAKALKGVPFHKLRSHLAKVLFKR